MNLPACVRAIAKKKVFVFLLLLLVGMGVGFLGGRLLEDFFSSGEVSLPLGYKLSVIVWLPLAFLLPVAVHELGHVVAGLLQGFEFRSYTVAIFHFYKEEDRLKFRFISSNAKSFLGLALCLPPAGLRKEQLTRRFAAYAFGGPAANLILGLVLLLPYFLSWSAVGKEQPLAYTCAVFAMVIGLISLLLFLINMIPTKSAGLYTDGGRILNMLCGGDEAFLDSAILSVMAASTGGTPPEELNEALLQEAADLPVESIFVNYCHAYLYTICMQRGNTAQAKHHLEQYAAVVKKIPIVAQPAVWLELAFFEARYGNDPLLAREHYSKVKPSPFITKDVYLRAEAAVALREENYAVALNLAREAQALLGQNPDRGSAKAYNVWLDQLVAEAEHKLAGTHQVVW